MLFASDISKGYSDRTLFSGLSFNVAAGDRIALIGANGSGKTTLMDILAGETLPDTGSLSTQRNVSIGYLKQDLAAFTDKPLLQEVLDAKLGGGGAGGRNLPSHEKLCRWRLTPGSRPP